MDNNNNKTRFGAYENANTVEEIMKVNNELAKEGERLLEEKKIELTKMIIEKFKEDMAKFSHGIPIDGQFRIKIFVNDKEWLKFLSTATELGLSAYDMVIDIITETFGNYFEYRVAFEKLYRNDEDRYPVIYLKRIK